jgi:hypothetical protein
LTNFYAVNAIEDEITVQNIKDFLLTQRIDIGRTKLRITTQDNPSLIESLVSDPDLAQNAIDEILLKFPYLTARATKPDPNDRPLPP